MWMECLYCLFHTLLRCKSLILTKLCCVLAVMSYYSCCSSARPAELRWIEVRWIRQSSNSASSWWVTWRHRRVLLCGPSGQFALVELPHPAFYRAVSRHTILLLFFLVPSSYFELLLTSLCLNMARKRSLVIISADLTNNIFALFPAVTNWLHLFGSDAVPTVSLQPPTAESRQNALAASFCSSWTERLLFGSASRATFRGTFFSSFFRPHQPNHLLAGSRQAVLNVCPRSWLYFYQNTFNYGIKQLDLWPRAVHPS